MRLGCGPAKCDMGPDILASFLVCVRMWSGYVERTATMLVKAPFLRPTGGGSGLAGQRTAAHEFTAQTAHRIGELDALRQQPQRRAEVVRRHVIGVGIQRITLDRYPERGHVHPELVGASGARRQPVRA